MDLGITGKRAVVCASSKGLGLGCAEALAAEGCDLVMNARGAEALEAAADAIRAAYGVDVVTVVADVSTTEGQAKLIAAADDSDILVNNAGGPPPGWGRVVNITSQSVKAPIPVLGLSNSARTGLTGYVAGTSRQVAGSGVTINNLLPGIHATDRANALDGNVVKAQGITLDEARARRAATIPAGRYGTREEFGAACAFLCSRHAGFIVGQNLLLDGGATVATI